MAKVMTENRELCEIKCEPYKKMIKEATDRETQVLESIKKTPAGVEYQKLNLCDEMIGVATYYIQINALTVELVNTKDNEALNNARKMLYKAIIYLEEVVSNVVDALQSDMEEKLASISNASVEKRFYLIRKLGLCIDILIEAFGDNSKWKESFVELQGRFATVAKNLLDLKKATKDYFDPNSPDYETSALFANCMISRRQPIVTDMSLPPTELMICALRFCSFLVHGVWQLHLEKQRKLKKSKRRPAYGSKRLKPTKNEALQNNAK